MDTVDSWLLLGTVCMALGSVAIVLLGSMIRREDRHHTNLAAGITIVAATAYFAMTQGLGDFDSLGVTVQSARYIDWLVTTPMLLVSLGLIALPSSVKNRISILATLIFLDVYMVVTGFVATVADSSARWMWYAASTAAFLGILVLLFGKLSVTVKKSGGKKVYKLYTGLSIYLSLLWLAYPLVWLFGVSGLGYLSFLAENAYYTILDLLAKVGFGLLLVWNVKKLSDHAKVKDGDGTIDALAQ